MKRIEKLRRELKAPVFVEGESDLFYLTGLKMSKGRLLVAEKSILFVDGRYYETALKKAPCEVRRWEEQWKMEGILGFDSSKVTVEEFQTMEKKLKLVAVPNPVKRIRAIKEKEEIEALRRAAKHTMKGIELIISHLKEGVSEEELAWEFEKHAKGKISFEPIIAFGENSAYPHHRAGKTKLKRDQIVLIDVGAIVDEYHGDMTRTHHFGKIDPKLVEFEKIVKRAQGLAIAAVKPGENFQNVDQIVQDEFDRENVKRLYIHSLGHGVGLETHEWPRLKVGESAKIEEGMVVTIEPGLYLEGLGGVRLEDMVVVTSDGCEILK